MKPPYKLNLSSLVKRCLNNLCFLKLPSNINLNDLTDFRKFTGRRLADYCDQHCPPCFGAALKAAAPNDRERRFWQPTRHPVGIATEQFWQAKLDYLHDNPCRKGLVRRAIDWRFSSAINFIVDANAENDVILTPLQW